MRIFLIGFMGSGKSYTGKRLATALGCGFHDLDERIESLEACSVAEIFRDKGESYFRELESQILRETERFPRAVISCGGGTPCFHGNMDWMNAHGITIWLDPPVEVIYWRLQRKPHKRPLLTGLETEEAWRVFIEAKLAERRPYYRQAQFAYRQASEAEDAAEELIKLLNDSA